MKKINIENLILIICIILLVFVLGFFFLSITPQFTIYKEECWNEFIDPIKAGLMIEYNHIIIQDVKITKKVCEKVEVEEINNKGLIWVGNECIGGYLGGKVYDSLGNEEPHCRVIKNKTYQINETKILKKDITKEWLDAVCNCLDICEDLSCSNRNKCEYYKCFEDYFVEVKIRTFTEEIR